MQSGDPHIYFRLFEIRRKIDDFYRKEGKSSFGFNSYEDELRRLNNEHRELSNKYECLKQNVEEYY